jgi:hypothetical protein
VHYITAASGEVPMLKIAESAGVAQHYSAAQYAANVRRLPQPAAVYMAHPVYPVALHPGSRW